MFEKFNDGAIKSIMLAQEEARRLGHNFVGSEQILLGLISENSGTAAKVLKSFGVNLKNSRIEVEKIIGRGSGYVSVEIPFTPRAKYILEKSLEEARKLGDTYIGTKHLLLGLIKFGGEGVGERVLKNLGIDLNDIDRKLKKFIADRKNQYLYSQDDNSYQKNEDSYQEENSHFELFSEKSLKVIMLAQEEVRRLNHNKVGTESLLLGILGESTGTAAKVLNSRGVYLQNTRLEVERLIGFGNGSPSNEIPFTPGLKQVFQFAYEESLRLGNKYICTEHLLLGIIRKNIGSSAKNILIGLSVDPEDIKKELNKFLNTNDKKFNFYDSDENFNENNQNKSIEEDEIIRQLAIIGINKIDQLNKKDVFYWWQKKYLEISKSNLPNENELLISLNNAKEKLDLVDLNLIKEKLKNKKINNKLKFESKNDEKYKSAEYYNELGDKNYDLGEFKLAIKNYNEAIKLDPLNSNYFHGRGAAKDSLGNYKDAIADYDLAILLNSSDAYIFNSRAVAKANLGLNEEALKDFENALSLDPTNELFSENRNNALNTLEEKKINEPKSATLWKIDGDILREQKNYKDSINYYNNAIKQEINYSSAYLGRGLSKYELKDFTGAISDWQRAIFYSNDKATTYLEIGDFKYSKGEKKESIEYYDKGIEENPKNWMLYFQRGFAKRYLKDFEGSLSDFEKGFYYNPYPEDESIDKEYSYVKEQIRKKQEAEKIKKQKEAEKIKKQKEAEKIKKQKELEKINAKTLMNKKSSQMLKKQGDKYREEFDFEKSLEFYSKSIEKDPRYTLAYICRGFSKYELGDHSNALKDWEEGIQFETKKSDIYLSIGDFMLTRGKFSESLKYYDIGIRNSSNNAKLFFNRGLAKFYICEFQSSLIDFEAGFRLDPHYSDKSIADAYLLVKKKIKERLITSKKPKKQLSEVIKNIFLDFF